MSKAGRVGRRTLPFAFTEYAALMAAAVLNSPRAVAMTVYIIRAFVKMRDDLAANVRIFRRHAEIDKTLLVHDAALREMLQKLVYFVVSHLKPEVGTMADLRRG